MSNLKLKEAEVFEFQNQKLEDKKSESTDRKSKAEKVDMAEINIEK